MNYDLCLPLPDLGTRFLSQSSRLSLPRQINLMMYRGLGRKLGIEAQYPSIRRQMGHKWYLLSHLCFLHILDLPYSAKRKVACIPLGYAPTVYRTCDQDILIYYFLTEPYSELAA